MSSGALIYQLHDGPIAQVYAVRNRGVAQVFTQDVPTYAALAGLDLPEGRFATCLAGGYVRYGSPPSLPTVAARGDTLLASIGYAGGSPMSIALKLLRGPAGITAARTTPEAFAGWPTAEAGLWVTGGTVDEAMERLAAGVGGWWGADAFGVYRGGIVSAPEDAGAGLALEPWMLAAAPEEVDLSEPPWFRVRVGFQTLDRVMAGEDVAPVVGSADRAFLTQASRIATPAYSPDAQRLPSAVDGPVLDSLFDGEAAAAAMAARQLALFGRPRRSWRVQLRTGTGAIVPQMVMPGAVLTLLWPDIAALRQPRPVLVRDLSARGDNLTLTLWG